MCRPAPCHSRYSSLSGRSKELLLLAGILCLLLLVFQTAGNSQTDIVVRVESSETIPSVKMLLVRELIFGDSTVFLGCPRGDFYACRLYFFYEILETI